MYAWDRPIFLDAIDERDVKHVKMWRYSESWLLAMQWDAWRHPTSINILFFFFTLLKQIVTDSQKGRTRKAWISQPKEFGEAVCWMNCCCLVVLTGDGCFPWPGKTNAGRALDLSIDLWMIQSRCMGINKDLRKKKSLVRSNVMQISMYIYVHIHINKYT